MSVPSKHISHQGIVKGIDKNMIIVQILDNIHCQSCDLKSSCGSVSEENLLKIVYHGDEFNLYEKVQVMIRQQTGMKAVFFGYVLPFIIMMAFLLGGIIITKSEWQAGLLALLSVVGYYALLFVFQKRMRSEFDLTIIKN